MPRCTSSRGSHSATVLQVDPERHFGCIHFCLYFHTNGVISTGETCPSPVSPDGVWITRPLSRVLSEGMVSFVCTSFDDVHFKLLSCNLRCECHRENNVRWWWCSMKNKKVRAWRTVGWMGQTSSGLSPRWPEFTPCEISKLFLKLTKKALNDMQNFLNLKVACCSFVIPWDHLLSSLLF